MLSYTCRMPLLGTVMIGCLADIRVGNDTQGCGAGEDRLTWYVARGEDRRDSYTVVTCDAAKRTARKGWTRVAVMDGRLTGVVRLLLYRMLLARSAIEIWRHC